MMGLDDWDTQMTEPGSNKRLTEDRVASITRRRIDVPVTPPGAGPYRVVGPARPPYMGVNERNPRYAAYPPAIRANEGVPRLPHSLCTQEEVNQDMGVTDTRLTAITNENKKKHIRGARHDEF